MGIVNYTYNRSTSGGEIITHLINSTDGTGLHFDGAVGSYVDCGDTTILDGATQISMEVIAATSDTGNGQMIGKSYDAHCIMLRFDAAGTITAKINNGSSTADTTSSGTYNDGNPKHIVVTWNGSKVKIYVNGNQDGESTLTGGSIPNTTDKLALGAELNSGTSNSSQLDGVLYRARLFNYVIDPTRFYENATVPFDDQYGSQTVLISVVTGLDGWDTLNTWNSQTTAGSNMILSANASGQYCRTNTALEVGKKYRLIYTAASVTGNSYFGGNWAGGFTNIHQIVAGTNTVDFTFEFASGFVNDYFYCHSGGIATVTLSNLSLVEIGCVVDLDLAFANPTQSNLIQDRAGNADGTKKPDAAGGVVQVTPIEQLNSKAISVSNATQRTPASGDIVADKVGVGAVPNLELFHAKSDDIYTAKLQRNSTTTGHSTQLSFGISTNDTITQAAIRATRVDADEADLSFWTGADAGLERLTIDSAGVVNINGPAQDLARLIVADNAEATRSVLALVSTVTTAAANVKADLIFNVPVTATSATASGLCRIFGAKENASSGNVAGYLSFETRPAAGSLTERMRIDSAGFVGIGATVPNALLHIKKAASGVMPGIHLERTGAMNHYIGYDTANNFVIAEAVDMVTAVRLSISSAGLCSFANGIAFQSATTGTGTGVGYTLDSYEEGTFTATLTAATPPTTPPTCTATYVKVGKMCTWAMRFGDVDTSGGAGDMKVTGLPFTIGSVSSVGGGWASHGMNRSAAAQAVTWGVSGQTYFTFYESTNGGAWANIDITAGTGKYLQLAGTYITT